MAFYATVQDFLDALSDHGFTDETQARQIEVLNDAYYDVLARNPWPFLEKSATGATVAANALFTNQPSDLRAVLSLICDTASTPSILLPIRLDDLTKRYAGSLATTTGEPYYYYFVGEQIQLFPVPDAIYSLTIRYIQTPIPMAAAGDVPIIPQRHRRVLLLGALARLYAMEDDPDNAMLFTGQYEDRIQKMWYDLSMKQFDRPDAVADMYFFDTQWD